MDLKSLTSHIWVNGFLLLRGEKKIMKKNNFFKQYGIYITAFFIPVFIILLHCAIREVWLFGNGSMLTGDAGCQYIYLYEELWNKVHSGDFSFFSWNATGGFDFYLNFLYYMISPATIIMLFLPKSWLADGLQAIMVVKWGLLSLTSVYFFAHTKFNTLRKNRQLVALTLGLSYALSGCFLSILQYFNWFDTLILFPVLLLLVEKLVSEGKWKLYYILLTVAMLCNFYMAYMICIFLLFWFFLQLQTTKERKKCICARFFLSSMLAACSSMAVILPSVLNVGQRFDSQHGSYVSEHGALSLAEFITRFFAMATGEYINVYFYISMEVLAVAMLFCFIKMRKRVKYTILGMSILFLLSLFVSPLNLLWTGFVAPHGATPRYTFLMLMMLEIMALCVIVRYKQIKTWHCVCVLLAGGCLFAYAFFKTVQFEEVYVYLITLFSFVFTLILVALLSRKSIKKQTFLLIFFICGIVELSADAYVKLYKFNVLQNIAQGKELSQIASVLSVDKGERIELDDADDNAGMSLQIPSMSGFISYTYGKLGTATNKLGIPSSIDSGIKFVGGTPLHDLIFNIAYDMSKLDAELVNMSIEKQGENMNIYHVNQLAGLGYMVNSEITDWDINGGGVFDRLNEFINHATDIRTEKLFNTYIPSDMKCMSVLGELEQIGSSEDASVYSFTPVFETDGVQFSYTVEQDSDMYFYMESTGSCSLIVNVDDKCVYRKDEEIAGLIIPIGKVRKGQSVNIICLLNNQVGKQIHFLGKVAELNEDVWQTAYHSLSEETYQISDMRSDYVCGTIEPYTDGIMMTSIPAMRGFDVYVDDEKTEYRTIGNALIGVPLRPGKHKVEFRYHTPFARLGWVLSLCGGTLFLIIVKKERGKHESVLCESK